VPDLGYIVNVFLNASFDIIKNSLLRVISAEWAKIFESKLSSMLNKVPIEELFIRE
jgi:hypothetical protein